MIADFFCVEEEVFAESFGLILVNSELMGSIVGKNTVDLLHLFQSEDIGDEVCKAGAAIPIIGLALGYYQVSIGPRSPLVAPLKRSDGWIFHAAEPTSILCGLGYLQGWDPDDPRHRRVPIPAGWYAASIVGGMTSAGQWGLHFDLKAVAEKPPFTANLSQAFDLYLDE
jgi:hypothetical protein